MAGRAEKCSGCGVLLLIPPNSQSIRCAVCQKVSFVQTNDPLDQAQSYIYNAANRLKALINTAIAVPSAGIGYPMLGASNYGYNAQPPRPLMPPTGRGRKKALLCGVSYYGRRYRLKGSVNDVMCMRYFLVHKLGFPNDSILVLTEDEREQHKIPTKQNMRMAMRWLVQGCQSGDSLVFHFSGHGSRHRHTNMDEVGGYDEALCPVDYETEGTILDDEINSTIVRPIPDGAKLHSIIDACHSGTVLDLPFVCRISRDGYYVWEDHRRGSTYKGTSGGLAVSFSACADNQISVDTTALSGSASTGAMTYSFIQAVQNEPGLTYGRLPSAMKRAISEAKTGLRLQGPVASLINKVLRTTMLSQEPQLSSSEKFDIYSKRFIL